MYCVASACTYELLPDTPFDRGLRWSVPATAITSTRPASKVCVAQPLYAAQPIHDRLLFAVQPVAARCTASYAVAATW